MNITMLYRTRPSLRPWCGRLACTIDGTPRIRAGEPPAPRISIPTARSIAVGRCCDIRNTLHGRNGAALFAGTAPAKQAAQYCKDEGLLRVLRAETKGKAVQEICALTDKGLTYLFDQVAPRKVLEDLVHVLEGRRTQFDHL